MHARAKQCLENVVLWPGCLHLHIDIHDQKLMVNILVHTKPTGSVLLVTVSTSFNLQPPWAPDGCSAAPACCAHMVPVVCVPSLALQLRPGKTEDTCHRLSLSIILTVVRFSQHNRAGDGNRTNLGNDIGVVGVDAGVVKADGGCLDWAAIELDGAEVQGNARVGLCVLQRVKSSPVAGPVKYIVALDGAVQDKTCLAPARQDALHSSA